MDPPGVLEIGIGLENLAATYVMGLRMLTDAEIVRIGIGLEGAGTRAIV